MGVEPKIVGLPNNFHGVFPTKDDQHLGWCFGGETHYFRKHPYPTKGEKDIHLKKLSRWDMLIPLFLGGSKPPKRLAFSNENKGSVGFQVYFLLHVEKQYPKNRCE